MNPYLLPEGNIQIALSGGRTSARMLRAILDENGPLPPRAIVTFQNTAREMNETLDFIGEIERHWQQHVFWLEHRPPRSVPNPFRENELFAAAYADVFSRERLEYMREWWDENATDKLFAEVSHNSASRQGEPFEVMLVRRKFLPNQATRFCTTELKVRTAKRFLRSLGWEHWANCVGIRADEAHRSTNPPKDRWTIWRPLVDAGVSRRDVSDFWRSQPFDLRLPNVNGNCWLGNCDGCFLKSEAHVAAFSREFPERARWWEAWEALASILSKARGITPGRGAWWSKRYTRRELREFMDRQGDWALSTKGALCQASDGECFG